MQLNAIYTSAESRVTWTLLVVFVVATVLRVVLGARFHWLVWFSTGAILANVYVFWRATQRHRLHRDRD